RTQVLRIHVLQQVGPVYILIRFYRIEAQCRCLHTAGYHFINTFKSTTANEQDVLSVHFYHLLLRVLAAALWWHQHFRTFQQLQHRLLHTFTAYIAGNGWVIALTAYFIYFIYIHNTTLCSSYIKVA